MRRRATVLLLAPGIALALAACGGSGKSSSSTISSTASASTASSTTTTGTSTTSGGSAATATGAGTSTRPPEVPSTVPTKTTSASSTQSAPAGGATNVHVRASFTIHGRALSPPVVTVPAFVAVGLTIASGDGRSHHVAIRTPVARSVSVPAGGHASILLPGTRAGAYAVMVDGRAGGSLLVGAEGGP